MNYSPTEIANGAYLPDVLDLVGMLAEAAFAAHYFDPMIIADDPFDGNSFNTEDDDEEIIGALFYTREANWYSVYALLNQGLRNGLDVDELESITHVAIKDYYPHNDGMTFLHCSTGHLDLPFYGVDWLNVESEHPAFTFIGDLFGIENGDISSDAYQMLVPLADSLHASGYSDVASLLRWGIGAVDGDILSFSQEEAWESGMALPPLTDADEWTEETELAENYIRYALKGGDYLMSHPDLQTSIRYNQLLLRYAQMETQYHVERTFDTKLVWTERDCTDDEETHHDPEILSIWHRPAA